jgi:hypothetical protein
MASPRDPISDQHASPNDVAVALEARIDTLYGNGLFKECIRDGYTTDLKVWLGNELYSGRDDLEKVSDKQCFRCSANIPIYIVSSYY